MGRDGEPRKYSIFSAPTAARLIFIRASRNLTRGLYLSFSLWTIFLEPWPSLMMRGDAGLIDWKWFEGSQGYTWTLKLVTLRVRGLSIEEN